MNLIKNIKNDHPGLGASLMVRKLTAKNKKILSMTYDKDSVSSEVCLEFMMRVGENDNEAMIVLVGHLLIENLIDVIIKSKCKSPKSILNDSRIYPFSVKLNILYSMGLIPDFIHNNILRINKFRNKFAHDIDFEIDPQAALINCDDGFVLPFGEVVGKKKTYKRYYYDLCFSTMNDLSNSMFSIGIDPRRNRIK